MAYTMPEDFETHRIFKEKLGLLLPEEGTFAFVHAMIY